MRIRNIKNANEIMKSSPYIILNPEDYQNNWAKLFNNDHPINLEIGMGKGDFIIDMALKNPEINFIGLEKYTSVIVRALKKLADKKITNLYLINGDALNLNNYFNKEINAIYLNFSDPWPKKRNAKRRLTSDIFLQKYDKVFKGKKRIIQKTDNIGLFAYSITSLSTYGYTIDDVTLDLKNEGDYNNVQTEYEKKF